MTWTAPEVTRPGGSPAAGERALLTGLLAWHRSTLLHKCAGLTGEQLAERSVPPSDLSLLGLIRHLAKVERIWFRERFAGQDVPRLHSTEERGNADFEEADPARAAEDYALLLEEQRLADEVVAGASLDDTFTGDDGETYSLRFIHLHLIGEYARHNGHADLVRERVDGVTGG
ncbi:DinB family protein [Streptomyces sp. NPDC008001]|uniref:DinB family protein n=1 Tax=Streptomyces sp. NPDC008001 TaxID=3364804 RepID=UPI0036E35C59